VAMAVKPADLIRSTTVTDALDKFRLGGEDKLTYDPSKKKEKNFIFRHGVAFTVFTVFGDKHM
jgi:hypothetical protein